MVNLHESYVTELGLSNLRFPESAVRYASDCLFICVEFLRPSEPNGVMSSAISYLTTFLLGRLSLISG